MCRENFAWFLITTQFETLDKLKFTDMSLNVDLVVAVDTHFSRLKVMTDFSNKNIFSLKFIMLIINSLITYHNPNSLTLKS